MIRKKGNYEIYFEDECHFQRNTTIVRAWFLKGTTPMNAEIFNAVSLKAFVKRIIKCARTQRKILLVLDNARFHHAIINRKFLKSVKDEIVLMYLPAYSPELNPIESFWKKTRRAVTHNRYYESLGRRENA